MASNDINTNVKKKKEKRSVNIIKGLRKVVGEIRLELKRVTWPTRRELLNYTVTVLFVCVLMGVLIYAFDFGLKRILVLTLDIGI